MVCICNGNAQCLDVNILMYLLEFRDIIILGINSNILLQKFTKLWFVKWSVISISVFYGVLLNVFFLNFYNIS